MSTPNVTRRKQTDIPSSPIREEASLENITSEVAAMSLSAKRVDSTLSLDPLRVTTLDKNVQSDLDEVTLLEADVGMSFERLTFLQSIELPQFRTAPGYPLVFASWILGAPDLFNDLLRITPQDKVSVQILKEHFNQMFIDPLFKERKLQSIGTCFHKLTYNASKVKKITEKTLATPFRIKTDLHRYRENSLSHRVELEDEVQPRAIEYLTRLLSLAGHTETSLPGVLQVIHIPRSPKEPADYCKVWCLDQFLMRHKMIHSGESKYIVLVREQRWRSEEEYALLPVVEFSVGEVKYRLKSFSTINVDDNCLSYLVENTSLLQIKSTSVFKSNESIKYFNGVDILNTMEIYLKASREKRRLLKNPADDFMTELMLSLDSCIYEKVYSLNSSF